MFTDKEYRILLSALSREREVCKAVDRNYVHEPYEVLLTDICSSIEKKIHNVQYKYRWHDLRKNKEDLPIKEGLYAVVVQYDTELSEIGFGYYENMYGYSSGWSALRPNYGSIIAWKEIEPFEEE